MISVKNLYKEFKASNEIHSILNGIDIDINKGEKVAIIGPSGSGKSTFLRCLNMLEVPTSGEIIFEGQNILDNKCDINKIRSKMGMVFQNFNLFPHLTIQKNITLAPITIGNKSKEEAEHDATVLLKKVGLESKINAYPSSLSGGQKQRIAIVRALAMNPDLMLFDAPTSALDPEMVKEVLDIVKDLAKEGMTMIFVTHEMSFAREIATRILFIDLGKIIEDENPNEFFEKPRHPRIKEFLSKVL